MDRPRDITACYVCVNTSCAEAGARTLLDTLTERLADSTVQVKSQVCFGGCWMGPNIVLYPERTWYSGVQLSDVDDIVAYIEGGLPVDRLIKRVDPQLHKLILSLLDAGLG